MTQTNKRLSIKVAVIGSGPAGLMAAEILSRHGLGVDVYDAMPSPGRKFLLAGIGGLNISHSEPFDHFLSRYGAQQSLLRPSLEAFGPELLRDWVHGLGINTFIGSSGRIFPQEMKAAPLLRAWLRRLRTAGVNFHMKHRWLGWCDSEAGTLRFLTPDGELRIRAAATVLALGGASWPQLGSTGAWVPLLLQRGISIAPLQPSNCGFDVGWSEQFSRSFAGEPLKPVSVTFIDNAGATICRQGEMIVTQHGLEGSLIYSLSPLLRDRITASGDAGIFIDLAPGKSLSDITGRLSRPRGKHSWANHLRKAAGVTGVKAGLLREMASQTDFGDPLRLASLIKALPIKLRAARPIAETISSAGGIMFAALDEKLMLLAVPGVFCAGEMLDWEAPTGGYLLTACFATGRTAAEGVKNWLESGGNNSGDITG